jgi:uncharacterized protein
MNRTFKATIAALVLAVGFGGPVAAGLLEDAAAAYMKGDYATALLLVRPLAERGNVHAQARLALLYELGQGVPQDDATAVSWYRKAAEQGDAGAQRSLGNMYRIGRGMPSDNAAAASWYRKAAEQGDARAQNNLGIMYDKGQGVQQDYVTAHMWLSLAAATSGFNEAVRNRDIVAKRMTPAQIAEAQKLAREWKPTSTSAPR